MKQYIKEKKIIVIVFAIIISCILAVLSFSIYENNRKQEIRDSIIIEFKKNLVAEYGDEGIKSEDFVETVSGNIKSCSKVDTKKVGTQKLDYVVERDGEEKKFNLSIEVKDTKAPIIKVKEEVVTIDVNNEYDIKSNIESVLDPVDGKIEYYEKDNLDKKNNYYILESDFDNSTEGEYEVVIKAIDKNKLQSEKKYKIIVNSQVAVEESIQNSSNQEIVQSSNESNSVATASKGSIQDVINTALAQVGKPYTYGGRGPNSFDCDGLVLYAFNQNGYSMSTSGAYSGYSVGNTLAVAHQEILS